MSESREQRQKALEERRQRIAQLKETRNRRVGDTARVQASVTANLDDYVSDLLSSSEPVVAVAEVKEASALPLETSSSSAAAPAAAIPVVHIPTPPAAIPKAETFEFGTQTEEDLLVVVLDEEEKVNDDNPNDDGNPNTAKEKDTNDNNDTETTTTHHDPKFLSQEQVQKEVSTKPFSDFLHTTSKKVERLLGTPSSLLSELLVDHVGQVPFANNTMNDSENAPKDERQFIANRQVYECPKWTSGRDMTHVDWSPWHRDCVLATYDRRGARSTTGSTSSIAVAARSPHDTPSDSLTPRSGELQSDGLALIWNNAMPQRPEHVFTCGSPVTTGRFHPTEAPLVVGGCDSGQVVVWDVRAGRLPVQKSTLVVVSGSSSNKQVKGHAHSINSMAVLEGGVRTFVLIVLDLHCICIVDSFVSCCFSVCTPHFTVRNCDELLGWQNQFLVLE